MIICPARDEHVPASLQSPYLHVLVHAAAVVQIPDELLHSFVRYGGKLLALRAQSTPRKYAARVSFGPENDA